VRRLNVFRWLVIFTLLASSSPTVVMGQEESPSVDQPAAPNDFFTFIPFVLALGAPPPSPTPSETPSPTSPTPTGTTTATATATETSTPPPVTGDGILVNHTSLALFDQIPVEYIQAASAIHLLFRHASVGANISNGLDCLMNKVQPRPSFCDRNLPEEDIFYDPIYNRDNWHFEIHNPPSGLNPGWERKVTLFIERVDGLGGAEDYDVVSYKFGYVDGVAGTTIDDYFYNDDPNDNHPGITDLEALEARHPDKLVVYWTMGLARLSSADSDNLNTQARTYAAANDKPLMDIAAIESHLPDGTPCYDNQNQGHEAICDEYTEELNGGHLNALGMQRMAKAYWVLVAQIAGWVP
jgi:hypothetical protein